MSAPDWAIFRKRETRLAASMVGRRAEYRSASGLQSTVLVLTLDDTQTTAQVRHPFGTAWLPLTELKFRD